MSQQIGNPEVGRTLPARAEEVRLRFEDQLRAGQKPDIAEALSAFPGPGRDELLSQLLLLEWEDLYQRGEAFSQEEYCRRFDSLRPVVETAWRQWKAQEHPSWSTAMPTKVGPMALHPPAAKVAVELSGYERFSLLGKGGMGEVYRAFDPQLKRQVAIKFIRAEHLSAQARERFEREGQALARLQHPHIAQVYSWQNAPSGPALVMEYIPGGTLEERLGGSGLTVHDSARLVAILARAMQAAHAVGIVHRDLKPANVLMAPPVEGNSGTVAGGFPKVTDFGLARLLDGDSCETVAGTVMGTPLYMSPEQAAGDTDQVGPASDVWALGVILYRCLSGKLPFAGDSVLETLERIKTQPPHSLAARLPGISCELEQLCLRCLDKHPSRRPTSAELARQLEALREESGSSQLTTRRWVAPTPRRWLRGTALSLALALAAAAIIVAISYRPGKQPVNPARPGGLHMQVRIWRPDTKFQNLTEALPISQGDEVQVRLRLAGGLYASLYLVNEQGRLRLLQRYDAEPAEREVVYPGEGKTKELQGKPGSEMIFAVSSVRGPVADDEVQNLWGEADWPAEAARQAVHLGEDKVDFAGERPRDFGATHDRAEASEVIRARLEEFRSRLQQRYASYEGVAFGNR